MDDGKQVIKQVRAQQHEQLLAAFAPPLAVDRLRSVGETELEVTAIVKGTKNLEAAKKLADWAATKKANELYAKTYPIVAYPGVAITPLTRELLRMGTSPHQLVRANC